MALEEKFFTCRKAEKMLANCWERGERLRREGRKLCYMPVYSHIYIWFAWVCASVCIVAFQRDDETASLNIRK